MFLASQCNDCSTAPLSQNKNNEIFQEITKEENYTTANTEYWLAFSNKGYIISYQNYNIPKEDKI